MKLRRATADPCGEALDLAIFEPERRALEHIQKHVLDRSERWDTIVPGPTIDAALDGDPAALERLYHGYADEIAAGLRFASRLPCHVHVDDPARAAAAPASPETGCFGFLSRRGVRIFTDRRRVRTAYRTALRRGGHSDYAFFARAWFDLLVRSSLKTCLAGADAAPPNVVSWKTIGEGTP
jgi:hypothetical protein